MEERIGVIDLGSNTTRLIVMGYRPHHSFRLLDEVRERVRLAEGIGEDKALQSAPMQRGIEAMKLFRSFCDATGVKHIVPVATSAVREASNQSEFLLQVKKEAGLEMRVLSAEEEAYYGYLGTANGLTLSDAFLIDIGGGSTQVTMIRGRGFVRAFSQPIGALRATDRYVHSDPISKKDFKVLEQAVAETFTDLDWLGSNNGTIMVGIGGTIRTLAEMDRKAHNYPFERVHGYILRRERLELIVEQLRGLTLREREHLPGLGRDRADIILSGAVILLQLMRQSNFESITVSGQGIREGLFYEHFLEGETPPLFPEIRKFSTQNLARLYDYEPIHVAKVRDLSLSLFDQLRELHGYGEWERELLTHAAILHDIGVAVGYYDHHKHGAYLVLNSSLHGFTHREIIILATLVRYHRKGDVKIDEYQDVLVSDDEERIARLAALLRLAEHLERRKSQVIQRLDVEIGDSVRVLTQRSEDATVEIWDANRRAGFFKKAYGKDIEVV